MERREADLDALANLLREKPHTARTIAEIFQISKPTAYARVAKLAMRGLTITKAKVREGVHGPEADAFSIAA